MPTSTEEMVAVCHVLQEIGRQDLKDRFENTDEHYFTGTDSKYDGDVDAIMEILEEDSILDEKSDRKEIAMQIVNYRRRVKTAAPFPDDLSPATNNAETPFHGQRQQFVLPLNNNQGILPPDFEVLNSNRTVSTIDVGSVQEFQPGSIFDANSARSPIVTQRQPPYDTNDNDAVSSEEDPDVSVEKPPTLEELAGLAKTVAKKIDDAGIAGKDIILLTGKTRAGKSTTAKWIRGDELRSRQIRQKNRHGHEATKVVVEGDETVSAFRIGHRGACTRDISSFEVEKGPLAGSMIVDLPGDDDTSDEFHILLQNAMLKLGALSCARSVRFLHLELVHVLDNANGGDYATNGLLPLIQMFTNPEDSIKESTVFLFRLAKNRDARAEEFFNYSLVRGLKEVSFATLDVQERIRERRISTVNSRLAEYVCEQVEKQLESLKDGVQNGFAFVANPKGDGPTRRYLMELLAKLPGVRNPKVAFKRCLQKRLAEKYQYFIDDNLPNVKEVLRNPEKVCTGGSHVHSRVLEECAKQMVALSTISFALATTLELDDYQIKEVLDDLLSHLKMGCSKIRELPIKAICQNDADALRSALAANEVFSKHFLEYLQCAPLPPELSDIVSSLTTAHLKERCKEKLVVKIDDIKVYPEATAAALTRQFVSVRSLETAIFCAEETDVPSTVFERRVANVYNCFVSECEYSHASKPQLVATSLSQLRDWSSIPLDVTDPTIFKNTQAKLVKDLDEASHQLRSEYSKTDSSTRRMKILGEDLAKLEQFCKSPDLTSALELNLRSYFESVCEIINSRQVTTVDFDDFDLLKEELNFVIQRVRIAEKTTDQKLKSAAHEQQRVMRTGIRKQAETLRKNVERCVNDVCRTVGGRYFSPSSSENDYQRQDAEKSIVDDLSQMVHLCVVDDEWEENIVVPKLEKALSCIVSTVSDLKKCLVSQCNATGDVDPQVFFPKQNLVHVLEDVFEKFIAENPSTSQSERAKKTVDDAQTKLVKHIDALKEAVGNRLALYSSDLESVFTPNGQATNYQFIADMEARQARIRCLVESDFADAQLGARCIRKCTTHIDQYIQHLRERVLAAKDDGPALARICWTEGLPLMAYEPLAEFKEFTTLKDAGSATVHTFRTHLQKLLSIQYADGEQVSTSIENLRKIEQELATLNTHQDEKFKILSNIHDTLSRVTNAQSQKMELCCNAAFVSSDKFSAIELIRSLRVGKFESLPQKEKDAVIENINLMLSGHLAEAHRDVNASLLKQIKIVCESAPLKPFLEDIAASLATEAASYLQEINAVAQEFIQHLERGEPRRLDVLYKRAADARRMYMELHDSAQLLPLSLDESLEEHFNERKPSEMEFTSDVVKTFVASSRCNKPIDCKPLQHYVDDCQRILSSKFFTTMQAADEEVSKKNFGVAFNALKRFQTSVLTSLQQNEVFPSIHEWVRQIEDKYEFITAKEEQHIQATITNSTSSAALAVATIRLLNSTNCTEKSEENLLNNIHCCVSDYCNGPTNNIPREELLGRITSVYLIDEQISQVTRESVTDSGEWEKIRSAVTNFLDTHLETTATYLSTEMAKCSEFLERRVVSSIMIQSLRLCISVAHRMEGQSRQLCDRLPLTRFHRELERFHTLIRDDIDATVANFAALARNHDFVPLKILLTSWYSLSEADSEVLQKSHSSNRSYTSVVEEVKTAARTALDGARIEALAQQNEWEQAVNCFVYFKTMKKDWKDTIDLPAISDEEFMGFANSLFTSIESALAVQPMDFSSVEAPLQQVKKLEQSLEGSPLLLEVAQRLSHAKKSMTNFLDHEMNILMDRIPQLTSEELIIDFGWRLLQLQSRGDQAPSTHPDVDCVIHSLLQRFKRTYEGEGVRALYVALEKEDSGANLVTKHKDIFRGSERAIFHRRAKNGSKKPAEVVNSLHCCPKLEQPHEAKLLGLLNRYDSAMNSLESQLTSGVDPQHLVSSSVSETKKRASLAVGNPTAENVSNLLLGVAEVFTLTTIDPNSIVKDIVRPHNAQILTVLRLLGLDQAVASRVDKVKSWLPLFSPNTLTKDERLRRNHLAQVLTGQGKSITLAMLAAVWALMGYNADVVCYSEYLTNRDADDMKAFLSTFGVQDKVRYLTFEQLCGSWIKGLGQPVKEVLTTLPGKKKAPIQGFNFESDDGKRVLLIDEVDVFFSKKFYGQLYNAGVMIDTPEAKTLIKTIFQHRNEQDYDAASSDAATALFNSVTPQLQPVVRSLLPELIKNSKSFDKAGRMNKTGSKPVYEYRVREGYTSSVVYPNETMFAYLAEAARGNISDEEADEHLGLDLPFVQYSFAEIPKRKYEVILGVTGTLATFNRDNTEWKWVLPDDERTILERDFDISTFTFAPSTFPTTNALDFNFEKDVKIATSAADWSHSILQDIERNRPKKNKCAVAVFFKNYDTLRKFVTANAVELGNFLELHERTPVSSRDDIVRSATLAGSVLLSTRAFGRGTNFFCVDNVMFTVVQTFYSSSLSEEVQIRGRTARQNQPGRYVMHLNPEDLAKKFFAQSTAQGLQVPTVEEINSKVDDATKEKGIGVEKLLGDARTQKQIRKNADRANRFDSAKKKDEVSRNLLSVLASAPSQGHQAQRICDACMSTVCAATTKTYIVLLDFSLSMERTWTSLCQAYNSFLRTLKKSSPDHQLAVVGFACKAKVVCDLVNVGSCSYKLPKKRPEQCGYSTDYEQGFKKVHGICAKHSLSSFTMVFITDGYPNSVTSRHVPLLEGYCAASTSFPVGETYMIYFNDGAMPAAVEELERLFASRNIPTKLSHARDGVRLETEMVAAASRAPMHRH